jgi:hypothetical protein
MFTHVRPNYQFNIKIVDYEIMVFWAATFVLHMVEVIIKFMFNCQIFIIRNKREPALRVFQKRYM